MNVNIPCMGAMTMAIIDYMALFGTHCSCLTNIHGSHRYKVCNQN